MRLPIYSPKHLASMKAQARVVVAIDKASDCVLEQLQEIGVRRNNIFNLKDIISLMNKKLEERQYFDLPVLERAGEEIFVDVGSYDGMTSRRFMKWAKGQYTHIYAFEANQDLYKLCKSAFKSDCNVTTRILRQSQS